MKKIGLMGIVLGLFLSMSVTNVYGAWWNRGNHEDDDKPMRDDMGAGMLFGPAGENENFSGLYELAGIDLIIEEYTLEIQTIFLEAKTETLALKTDRKDLWEELEELVDDYDENDQESNERIIEITEELIEIQNEITSKNHEAMESIGSIVAEAQEIIQEKINEYVDNLEPGTEEFEEFIETMQDL